MRLLKNWFKKHSIKAAESGYDNAVPILMSCNSSGSASIRSAAAIKPTIPRWHYKIDYIETSTGRIIESRTADNLVTTVGASDLLSEYFLAGSQSLTWYVGLIKQQSFQGTGAMSSSVNPTQFTIGSPATTQTGQNVTIFGAGGGGANLVTTISTGTTGTTQTVVAPGCLTTVSNAVVVFGPTFDISDTAGSHVNWTEVAGGDITDSNRYSWQGGAMTGTSIVSVDNSASPVIYHPNTNFYACGLFIINQNTIGGGSGILYGEAPFTQGALYVQGAGAYQISISAFLQATAG